MKITIDIPEDGRQFQAFSGRELIAFVKGDGDTLYIKTTSCNYCGECCMESPSTIYGDDEEGKCKALVRTGDIWECGVGIEVPFRCLGDPKDVDCCSITYREVKLK
jgi:hypothetical protein